MSVSGANGIKPLAHGALLAFDATMILFEVAAHQDGWPVEGHEPQKQRLNAGE
jgi:hypothetical protein